MSIHRRHLLLAGSGMLLAGCNTVKEHRSVYDGLLPPGVLPRDAGVALPLTGTKAKSVALVLSSNFEDYVTTWVNHYERGGAQDRKSVMTSMGASLNAINPVSAIGSGLANATGMMDRAIASGRQASDPRRVIDRLHALLGRYFGKVQVVTDLADATDAKLDYIALADLHFTANAWGNAFTFNGGVHMLDKAIRKVFVIDLNTEVPRTMADVSGSAAFEQGLNAVSSTIERGFSQNLRA